MNPCVRKAQHVAESIDPEQQTPTFHSRARHGDTPINPVAYKS